MDLFWHQSRFPADPFEKARVGPGWKGFEHPHPIGSSLRKDRRILCPRRSRLEGISTGVYRPDSLCFEVASAVEGAIGFWKGRGRGRRHAKSIQGEQE